MENKRKKSKEMTYLLVCFGDFKDDTKVIRKIADTIMPAVSSANVKYYNNDLNIIYHFRSTHKFDDLKTFIDESVTDFVGMYFLFTCNNSVSLGMPTEIYDYLFDLDTDTAPPDMSKLNVITEDEQQVMDELDSKFMELMNMDLNDEDDGDLARILSKGKKEETPSLDFLLDKISVSGMGSLTKKEKEILQMYSSNK